MMLEEQKYANVIVNWRFPVQNVLKVHLPRHSVRGKYKPVNQTKNDFFCC